MYWSKPITYRCCAENVILLYDSTCIFSRRRFWHIERRLHENLPTSEYIIPSSLHSLQLKGSSINVSLHSQITLVLFLVTFSCLLPTKIIKQKLTELHWERRVAVQGKVETIHFLNRKSHSQNSEIYKSGIIFIF